MLPDPLLILSYPVVSTLLLACQVCELPQATRDHVGALLLRLTLRELFGWRCMQTDPNWGNFLYEAGGEEKGEGGCGTLHLIDFGAAREFPEAFVSEYLEMVMVSEYFISVGRGTERKCPLIPYFLLRCISQACADRDKRRIIEQSVKLGFLTGDESQVLCLFRWPRQLLQRNFVLFSKGHDGRPLRGGLRCGHALCGEGALRLWLARQHDAQVGYVEV